jgi:hypothetical protein
MANATRMSHVCADNPPMSIRPARSFVSWLIISAINPQHAFDPANDAANGCPNDGADRTSAAIALICAVRDAAGNPLRLRRDRHRSECNECGRNQNSKLHEVVLPVVWMATSWRGKKGHTAASGMAKMWSLASVVRRQRLPCSVPHLGVARGYH